MSSDAAAVLHFPITISAGLGQGTVSRDVDEAGHWKGVFRYTYDNMKNISPDYYSPQDLRLYEGGPEYSINVTKHIYFYARYLPGYGEEHGVPSQLVHDLETHVRFRLCENASLAPSFEYERTPTYYETIYSLEFKYVF